MIEQDAERSGRGETLKVLVCVFAVTVCAASLTLLGLDNVPAEPVARGGGIAAYRPEKEQRDFLLSEAHSDGAIERRLTLWNENSTRRKLQVARVSCSCVSAVLADEVIAAGKTSSVSLRLNAPERARNVGATVLIKVGDDAQSNLELKVGANFFEDVWTEPEFVKLRGAQAESVVVRHRRRVSEKGVEPFLRCKSAPDWANVVVPEEPSSKVVDGPFEVFDWKVRINTVGKSDEHFRSEYGPVVCVVDNQFSVKWTCEGFYEDRVVVAPERISIHRARVGQEIRRRFVLRASDSQPFSLLSVSCESENVRATIGKGGDQIVHSVGVIFTPTESGEFSLPIEFATSHKVAGIVTATLIASVAE